jgi:endonuclease/exonuclease/phosphatase family metal-dependent hydrolase
LTALLDAGWRDAVPAEAGGTFHDFTGATDQERIDHILVGKGWQVVDAEVSHHRPGGRLPSDHWPVVATLQLSV